MDNLLNFIFPPSCVVCGNYGSLFCSACIAECRKVRRHYFLKFQKCSESNSAPKPPPLDVFCYFVYERKIRECIRQSKYLKKQFAALREVTKFAVEDMLKRNVQFSADFIIPIPLSQQKAKYRGFNQAQVIAQVLSKAYLVPCQNSILNRHKDTTVQHRLNRKERMKNIQGAFKVKFPLEGYSFLLVDDICTTGATLLEAASTLYSAGASSVCAFTLAKRL